MQLAANAEDRRETIADISESIDITDVRGLYFKSTNTLKCH